VKPTYGIIENKVDTPKENKKRKRRQSKDPLIGSDEAPAVSLIDRMRIKE